MSIQKTPEPNTIFFTWFNQYAGILLKTPTKTIVVDPVDIKVKNLPIVDAILITHEHYDHLDPQLVTAIQKATDCTVIADPASTKKLQNTTHPNRQTPRNQTGRRNQNRRSHHKSRTKQPQRPIPKHLHNHKRRQPQSLPHSRQLTLPRIRVNGAKRTIRHCLLHGWRLHQVQAHSQALKSHG